MASQLSVVSRELIMDALLKCQEGITRRAVEAISNRKKNVYVKDQYIQQVNDVHSKLTGQ